MQLIQNKNNELTITKCFVHDYPNFQWRGLHLDVARHFFTVEEVKRYIDLMAAYKFNTFHWHLTDDQGWRVEIKKYPKLTEIGAWRDSTVENHYSTNPRTYEHKRYGGFYTQEQIKEVVQYAAERYVTIVPEIEMPGHARAALAAYPELSCTGKQNGVEGLCSHRQRDAGIAGSRLDQGVAGPDLAARLGTADHGERRTVFYRTRRIVAFQLDQHGIAGLPRQPLQPDQRGAADKVFDGFVHGRFLICRCQQDAGALTLC
jgi:N-acetyl-beta-hexosaminidase